MLEDRKEPHKRYDVRDGSSCEKVNISDNQTCWVCRAELLPRRFASLSNQPAMAERNEKCGLRTRERKAFLLGRNDFDQLILTN